MLQTCGTQNITKRNAAKSVTW